MAAGEGRRLVSVAEVTNTQISVLRGTTYNSTGDQVDDNQVFMENVPAFLAETGHTTQDPSSPTPRTIREIVCHVPQYVGVVSTDRIMDQGTGDTYIILSVTRPPSLIGIPVPSVLALKRITAQTS
jgi:hypothetical protein